jgi:hypothetical protein
LTHPRTTIRNLFTAALATPNIGQFPTSAGARVFPSRAAPMQEKDLPAIAVYARSETVNEGSQGADGFGPISRTLTIVVEIYADENETVDDELDAICAEVEVALRNIESSGNGVIESSRWRSTEIALGTWSSGSGARTFGVATLTYAVTYSTEPSIPAADPPISLVKGSWAPDIGIPHEPDYQILADTRPPQP